MSPVTTVPPTARRVLSQLVVDAAPEPSRPRKLRASLTLFAGAYLLYAAVGLYATLHLDVVVGDAQSRLAHAYMVWWNDPQKLAAIGFVWPPLQTIIFLPLVFARPLATSLAALPLMSAAFGAGLVVLLERTLRVGSVPAGARWPIVAAIALNPIVVYYAANGMAELPYLFFLALGLHYFVRWTRGQDWRDAAAAAFAFALGSMLRYEVALWLVLVLVGLAVVLAAARRLERLEATALVVAAPCAYVFTAWAFLNARILGEPLAFLTEQYPGRPEFQSDAGLLELAREAIVLNVLAAPAAFVAVVWAAVVAVRRRQALALVIGGFAALNTVIILGMLATSREPALLELRYNIRALPVAVVVLAWLVSVAPPHRRAAAGTAAALAVAASIPAAAYAMTSHALTIGERPFVRGLISGDSQDGESGTSIADQRDMARAIERAARSGSLVLTDDAATFGVILVHGRPDRFADRVDAGDEGWLRLARTRRGIDFLLIRRSQAGGPRDRLLDIYPTLEREPPPSFARLVHANRSYALFAVSKRGPGGTTDA